MPNYKLSRAITSDITQATDALLLRRIQHAQAGLPMTTEAIQRAIMREDHLKSLRELESDGMQGLPRVSETHIWLGPDYLLGITRGVIVELHFPKHIFVGQHTGYYSEKAVWHDTYPKNCATLNLGPMETDDKFAVAAWANRVVKEHRLRVMANSGISQVMRACTTTAEILANFPILAGYVTAEFWRGRFRTPPTRLAPYKRTLDAKLLEAAEIVLLGAEQLPEWEYDQTTILAIAKTWKPLANDPVFV